MQHLWECLAAVNGVLDMSIHITLWRPLLPSLILAGLAAQKKRP